MSRFVSRLRGLLQRGRLDREFEDELRFHLDMQAEDDIRTGMAPAEARHSAARKFGGVERAKESHREARSFAAIEATFKDLHYAVRMLRANPGFAATAIVSLALGIGANTAIFSLIDALLLRALPVGHPERLVQVSAVLPNGRPQAYFSYPMVRELAARKGIFDGAAGFSSERFDTGDGVHTTGAFVSGGYYETLRLAPIAGRLLTESDDQPGAAPVAVISDGYWSRRFGRDPRAVGRSIRIESGSATIVGVSPPGFEGMDVAQPADITLPIAITPQLEPDSRAQAVNYNYYGRQIVARLRDDVPIAQAQAGAQAKLAAIWAQVYLSTMPNRQVRNFGNPDMLTGKPQLDPAGNGWTDLRPQFQKPLLVLMGIAGLVLLIACANLANLLLARSTARQREIAVRLAIGAGRGRVIRQLLTESVLLAAAGASFGVAVAWLASKFLVNLLSSAQRNPITLNVSPNSHILLFAVAAAVATTLLFGLVPAFRATEQGPAPALKDSAGLFSGRRGRLGPALVILQVSLSVLLLIGAGVFIRTLVNLRTLDAGFRHDGVLIADFTAPAGLKGPQLDAFFRDLLDRARRLPGVVSASLSDNTPLRGGFIIEEIRVPGRPEGLRALRDRLAPGYFETLRTPILQGRDFTFADSRDVPMVAIVNQAFARTFFPGAGALGQHLRGANFDIEIVGVVADVRGVSLREPGRPAIYYSLFQGAAQPINFAYLVVHASGSLTQASAELRREFNVPFRPLDDQVEKTLIQERLMASLAGAFGALALILATVGLYGLLAYTVSRRTHEVGIRMALGAKQSQVLWMVVKDALVLLAAGAALGAPLAWPLSRLVSSLTYGLTPADPSTIALACAALALFGALAAFIPARRASRVEPMTALRVD